MGMKKEKKLFGPFSVIVALCYSNLAWAAEDVDFEISIWPFALLIAVLIIFRKKIIAESTVPHAEGKDAEVAKTVAPSPVSAAENTGASTVEASNDIVDLTQNVEQCQGTTAKGTRCSRTANLESIVVKVDNKQYRFLTCKQHHNEGFTPFHFRQTSGDNDGN